MVIVRTNYDDGSLKAFESLIEHNNRYHTNWSCALFIRLEKPVRIFSQMEQCTGKTRKREYLERDYLFLENIPPEWTVYLNSPRYYRKFQATGERPVTLNGFLWNEAYILRALSWFFIFWSLISIEQLLETKPKLWVTITTRLGSWKPHLITISHSSSFIPR